jgi:tRNA nucleotidyltransferase (CCA-adding enzyme)
MGQIALPQRFFEIRRIATDIMNTQQCFTIKDLAINGHDVMSLGVEPGPMVGKILNNLLNKVLDEDLDNEHEALMNEAARYLKGE